MKYRLKWAHFLFTRRYMYPNKYGQPIFKDPTHGRIDREIQWQVNDIFLPQTLGSRVAMESTLQARKDRIMTRYESRES